jgi:hypothetical protein
MKQYSTMMPTLHLFSYRAFKSGGRTPVEMPCYAMQMGVGGMFCRCYNYPNLKKSLSSFLSSPSAIWSLLHHGEFSLLSALLSAPWSLLSALCSPNFALFFVKANICFITLDCPDRQQGKEAEAAGKRQAAEIGES